MAIQVVTQTLLSAIFADKSVCVTGPPAGTSRKFWEVALAENTEVGPP